jgi:hypothetical protein
MPAQGKKKCTTPNTTDSMQDQSAPALPAQDEFRQHLRELARGAIRVVLEDVMREELDALISAYLLPFCCDYQLFRWVLCSSCISFFPRTF